MRIVLWFRGKDLRLRDNSALSTACQLGEVITVYVASPSAISRQALSSRPNRTAYLLSAIEALEADIAESGGKLIVLHGEPEQVLPAFVERHRVDMVFCQRLGFPFERQQIERISRKLPGKMREFDGETMLAPGALRNSTGQPYAVFTPFARAASTQISLEKPISIPRGIPMPPREVLAEHRQLPTIEQLGGQKQQQSFAAGEDQGLARLRKFLSTGFPDYELARDDLGRQGTSMLSADLHFGTISPRQVWYAANQANAPRISRARFLSQLIWREFAYSTLWDRPQVISEPFQPKFLGFPWRESSRDYDAWACGQTGFPIVDAAMRQLSNTGYMHNRARMIVASFLAKDLLIDFRLGEAHFLRHLRDGDLALNDMGWQWSSGTGCDAQPYFRVFNPITQGTKFDTLGQYVRSYVPELAKLPNEFIHCPWKASATELIRANVQLGRDYPKPILDHAQARKRYLLVAGEFFGNPAHAGLYRHVK